MTWDFEAITNAIVAAAVIVFAVGLIRDRRRAR